MRTIQGLGEVPDHCARRVLVARAHQQGTDVEVTAADVREMEAAVAFAEQWLETVRARLRWARGRAV